MSTSKSKDKDDMNSQVNAVSEMLRQLDQNYKKFDDGVKKYQESMAKAMQGACFVEPPPRKRNPKVKTLDDIQKMLQKSKNIVVITGAGISTNLGIPDFRSKGGLYDQCKVRFPDLKDPMDVFSLEYFEKNPVPFFELAADMWPGKYSPGKTHEFIARLEKSYKKLLRNYTQNIDTLERIAGVKKLVECHGSYDKATCRKCEKVFDKGHIKEQVLAKKIPKCVEKGRSQPSELCDGIIKPNVVCFGESLPVHFTECLDKDKLVVDFVIVIGTSMQVAPVKNLPNSLSEEYDKNHENSLPVILVNKEPVKEEKCVFDAELIGDCDLIVEQLENMLRKKPVKNMKNSEKLAGSEHFRYFFEK